MPRKDQTSEDPAATEEANASEETSEEVEDDAPEETMPKQKVKSKGKPKKKVAPLPAAPAPRVTAETFPIVVRDALGEFELSFETESQRHKACVKIQLAVTKVGGARPKEVVSLEGRYWFCHVQSICIPKKD